MRLAEHEPGADLKAFLADGIPVPSRRRLITPKTPNQKRYLDAIRTHDLVIAIGPAGTGKSYLAVAMAVAALMKREVARIVLTRPAVEAGERLGFLPGDLIEKVHPYLRPLYDALYDMLDGDKVGTLTERGAIEIAPLAYMRGRTLNDAFIILDEAQNSSSEQMKMFLTRLGFNSKMVITGDVTQVDLPASRPSGLIEVQTVLRGVDGIVFVYFDDRDVVRHDLVSSIVRAYDRAHGGRGPVPGPIGRTASSVLMPAAVTNDQRRVRVSLPRVRATAERALAALGRPGAEVHVALVDDAAMRRLHSRYLGQPTPTDVMAFELDGPGPVPLLGEVVVSAQTAARQARRLRVPVALEMDLLVVHGLLHLMGYDDGEARRGPPHARAGAPDPVGRPGRGRSPPGSGRTSCRRGRGRPSRRVRRPGGPPQRGQVHAAEPARQREDGHRVPAPADDPDADHRHPQPARRAGGLRRHARAVAGRGDAGRAHAAGVGAGAGGRGPRLLGRRRERAGGAHRRGSGGRAAGEARGRGAPGVLLPQQGRPGRAEGAPLARDRRVRRGLSLPRDRAGLGLRSARTATASST